MLPSASDLDARCPSSSGLGFGGGVAEVVVVGRTELLIAGGPGSKKKRWVEVLRPCRLGTTTSDYFADAVVVAKQLSSSNTSPPPSSEENSSSMAAAESKYTVFTVLYISPRSWSLPVCIVADAVQ
jgi:hypothetical protein